LKSTTGSIGTACWALWLKIFPRCAPSSASRRFEALSIAYLAEHPSRSFTLRNLGSKLPAWLAAHPEHTGRRHRLAVDMAKIEWAFVEAFDARSSLRSRSARLLRFRRFAARFAALFATHRAPIPRGRLGARVARREKRQTSEAGVAHEDDSGAQTAVPKLRPRPTWLAVHRVDLSVYYRRIGREEFQTLDRASRDGSPLGEALEAGFAGSRIPERQACRARAGVVWQLGRVGLDLRRVEFAQISA
jgi:hypothetical protein